MKFFCGTIKKRVKIPKQYKYIKINNIAINIFISNYLVIQLEIWNHPAFFNKASIMLLKITLYFILKILEIISRLFIINKIHFSFSDYQKYFLHTKQREKRNILKYLIKNCYFKIMPKYWSGIFVHSQKKYYNKISKKKSKIFVTLFIIDFFIKYQSI